MARKKVKETIILGRACLLEMQDAQKRRQAEDFFRLLEDRFPVRIALRGRSIQVKGPREEVNQVSGILGEYVEELASPEANGDRWQQAIEQKAKPKEHVDPVLFVTPRGKEVGPVNNAQRRYLEAMQKHDIVFAEGPAGTGKTYLAVAFGCYLLKERKIARLILTRPAVEAGEHLGFLPGDMLAKIEPYFRPIYDALFEMLEPDLFARFRERNIIEIAPLAYMRGRTLNDAFVILDEAQNTSPEQMKMFLTRLGRDSSAVVTGDTTQIDLAEAKQSGMIEAMDVLKHICGIGLVRFRNEHVIRHPLVQQIVEAYEKYKQEKRENTKHDS